LGWRILDGWQPYFFEHWWKLLRTIRADAYANTDGYSNSHAYTDGNCDPNRYSASKSHTDSYAYFDA
jgi:hypothetical protein